MAFIVNIKKMDFWKKYVLLLYDEMIDKRQLNNPSVFITIIFSQK